MKRKVTIIAEAGVNHNGDTGIAKRLIDEAAMAGADYIKFQSFKSEHLVTASAPSAKYQKSNTGVRTQLEILKKLELTEHQHQELLRHARSRKIKFLSTPFDLESIQLLRKLGITTGKIPSGEITSLPFLEKMARSFRNIIMSTGMATLDEIAAALSVLYKNGIKKESIVLLHCTTEYPAPFEDINLNAMLTIRKRFKLPVGYSDHTIGSEVAVAAVALGAVIIEKHFTLNRGMQGPDHMSSLEPATFAQMVSNIRNVEKALGVFEKKPAKGELANRLAARKSIVALTDINKGEHYSESNLTIKRPGNGISPMEWKKIIGKKSNRNYRKDELIRK